MDITSILEQWNLRRPSVIKQCWVSGPDLRGLRVADATPLRFRGSMGNPCGFSPEFFILNTFFVKWNIYKVLQFTWIYFLYSLCQARTTLVRFLNTACSNDFCSDFEQKFLSEIRTFSFGFQTDFIPNRNWNRTDSLCLKSERVRISDVYCIR